MTMTNTVVALAAFVSLSATACTEEAAVTGPRRVLSAYQGHATELIDDGIEPRAVGIDLESIRSPKSDPVLRARTQAADAIVRVRITTVTRKKEESGATYVIGFRVVDRVAGANLPPQDFSVELAPRAPAVGILRSFEDRLVGMNLTYVAFVRGFAQEGSPDGAMHFHLSPDTKEIVDAIAEMAALEELK